MDDKRRIALTVIKPTPKPTTQTNGKDVVLLSGVNGVSWNENGKEVWK